MLELSFEQTLREINSKSLVLLYLSMPDCGVCMAVKPRIEKLFTEKVTMLHLNGGEYPEIASQFLVLTAPVILVFFEGKEVHRQARFIDFKTLESVIDNYLNMDTSINYEDIFKEY